MVSAGGSSVGGEITSGCCCCDDSGCCCCDASVVSAGGSSVGGEIACGGGLLGGSRGGIRRRVGCLGCSDGSMVDVVIVSVEGGGAVVSSSENTLMGTLMFFVSTGIFASLTTMT